MSFNSQKIQKSHRKFLNKSREVVGKENEKFFVLMLRGAEAFCKNIDPDETGDNFGLTKWEVPALTHKQFDNLYRLLLSYFGLVLTGEEIPGSLRNRLSLINKVVGHDFLNLLMQDIDRDVEGSELLNATTNNATEEVVNILNAVDPDREQINQTLRYVAFEIVGMQAREISESKYCFIATNIYGDYDHPKVKTFRLFRDQYLAKSMTGKMAIKVYYKISPIFIKTKLFKSILRKPIKILLDYLAKYLDMKRKKS